MQLAKEDKDSKLRSISSPPLEVPRKHYLKKESSIMDDSVTWQPDSEVCLLQ